MNNCIVQICVNNREESKESGSLVLIAQGRLGGIQASKPGSLLARGWAGHLRQMLTASWNEPEHNLQTS